jgi:hypothetical protein
MIQFEKIEHINAGHFWRSANTEMLAKYPNLSELGKTDQRATLEAEFQVIMAKKEKKYLKEEKEIQKRNYALIKALSKPELLEILQSFDKSKDVSGGNVDDWNVQSMIVQGVLKCKIKRVGKGRLEHKGTIIQGIASNWIVTYEFGIVKGEFETTGQGKYIHESIYRMVWSELKSKLLNL